MRTVVFNQKGGVGKSTITVNLAAVGAARGRRTLMLDLDSQGNSTRYLLGEGADEARKGVADLFEQSLKFSVRSADPRAFVSRTPFERLDLVASDARLDEIHSKLESRYKIFKLRDALDALAELGQRNQVVYFTHHAHLVELAHRTVPAGRVAVRELEHRTLAA